MKRSKYCLAIVLGVVGLASSAIAQVQISPAGQPQIRIPLEVPKGIAALTPRLALVYTGDLARGPLGVGWKLDGLSVVTRCSPMKAIDRMSSGVTYSASDKVCLDGERLIRTSSAGVPLALANQINDAQGVSSGTGEFRTQTDSFSRIVSSGAEGGSISNGPKQFVVKTKDGRVLTYTAIDTRSSNSVAAVWPITGISDTGFFGEAINYSYAVDDSAWGSGPSDAATTGREWRLSEIDYASGLLASDAGNKIVFEYELLSDNPGGAQDRSEAYNQGAKNLSIRRLAAIKTYVNAKGTKPVPAKSYWLGYETSPTTGRSRLTTIKECAGDSATACLPATVLTYTAGGDETYASSTSFSQSSLASASLTSTNKTYGVLLGDFNGDGKTDIIRWSSSPASNQLWLSAGGGKFNQVSNTGLTSDLLFSGDGCYSSLVTDINGDGLPDIFRYSGSVAPSGASCSSHGDPVVFINKGNATFTRQTVAVKATGGGSVALTLAGGSDWRNFLMFDVDGDGRADIVTAQPPKTGVMTPPCPDGYACATLYLGSGAGTFTESASSNLYDTPLTIPPVAGIPAGGGYVADINGDGQLDVVTGASFVGSFTAFVSKANGYFYQSATPACQTALDVNGDGRVDCLDPSAGTLAIGDGQTANQTATYNISSSKTSGSSQGVVILDANHDGRYDLLRWTNAADATNPNILYLSNGDGSFRQSSSFASSLGTKALKKSDGSRDFVVGDFTGNGVPELLEMVSGGTNILYLKSDTSPPDLLATVTTPLGLKTSLSYEPLSNSTHYATGRVGNGSVILPKEDITPPMYVVTAATSDTGVGSSKLTKSYFYKGLRASMDGHGLLGFAEVQQQGQAPDGSNITVVRDFLQDAPYIGLPSVEQTYLGALNQFGQRLSRTTYSYCDTTSSAAGVAISTSNPTPPAPCATTSLVNRPYAYQTFAEAWDNHGNALQTVLTTRSMDGFGDETSKKVTVTGAAVAGGTESFVETTTSEYCPPMTDADSTAPACPSGATNPNNITYPSNTTGGNWRIGQATRVTVTRTAPDTLPSTSAGSSPTAAAVAGNGTPPPLNPAVLNVILSLLLDD